METEERLLVETFRLYSEEESHYKGQADNSWNPAVIKRMEEFCKNYKVVKVIHSPSGKHIMCFYHK